MGEAFGRRLVIATMAVSLVVAGCGLPGAPLPPSLNLPQRVTDLTAARVGNRVSLHWAMPVRNTDKTLVKGSPEVQICRREATSDACAKTGTLTLAPGVAGTFEETLHGPLAAGPARALTYFVELKNDKGRSAGLSNGATVLAGQAPPAVTGLTAKMAKNGVVLHWNTVAPSQEPGPVQIRLQRKLLTPSAPTASNGPLAPPPQPPVQNLLVPAGSEPGVALDKHIRFGQTYEYRAQRVLRVSVNSEVLELPGDSSQPVRIHAVNVFPPAVPTGLVAVATPAVNGAPPSVDLSWQPDSEPVAGYFVYRRQDDQPWQRISPAKPVIGPAFHDEHVQPGQSYQYAVSAVGQDGLESARSPEAKESVPEP